MGGGGLRADGKGRRDKAFSALNNDADVLVDSIRNSCIEREREQAC